MLLQPHLFNVGVKYCHGRARSSHIRANRSNNVTVPVRNDLERNLDFRDDGIDDLVSIDTF